MIPKSMSLKYEPSSERLQLKSKDPKYISTPSYVPTPIEDVGTVVGSGRYLYLGMVLTHNPNPCALNPKPQNPHNS